MRRLRLVLALVVLPASLWLLAWGVWPAQRERHVLHLAPSRMILPTPSAYAPSHKQAVDPGKGKQQELAVVIAGPAIPQLGWVSEPSGSSARRAPAATTEPTAPLVTPTGAVSSPMGIPGRRSTPSSDLPAAPPESRLLTLEYPARIRLGDMDVIRLTLEVDMPGEIAEPAQTDGSLRTAPTDAIPNAYDLHSVIAEADLDLTGMVFQPSQPVS
jgi:hypothetical protein